jgi:hypothetical protein
MRTIDATLADALANQKGETIIRVLTWADLAAYNAAPATPENTWLSTKFEIHSTSGKAEIITDNDYATSHFTVFIVERGVEIGGVEYVEQSGLYFVQPDKFTETPGHVVLEGSSYPNTKIVIAGDDTYQNVIEAFCTEIGKTAVFKDSAAAWLGYQFLATGKQVILNKAERFENLLKQKYTILCYERSPKEIVFYTATAAVSEWTDVLYADGQFVTVAETGTHEAAYSVDGAGWTKVSAPSYCNAVAYSPTLDLYVAVGASAAMSSPDGVTWTSRTIGTGTWIDVTWDSNLALFIAIRDGKTATSNDGITWTVSAVLYDYDYAWTARTAAADQWTSICWSPELSLFVAVAWQATNEIITSPDGITWTVRTAPEANVAWSSVCWSPALSLFVAVAASGTDRVMTSPDGITWTGRTAAEANQWYSVCWSPALSLLVAVANTGTNRVMTSPDGITWTVRMAAEANAWRTICWSPELSLFVAIATTGTNRVMTSPDGITWTARAAPEANQWYSVCWSPELSLFVAVAGDGTNRVMTSPDGITWTARAHAGTAEYKSVCWSPELFLFMAVSFDGAVMSSPDAITWTARTASAASRWNAITWSPSLYIFMALAWVDAASAMSSDATAKSLISIDTDNTTLAIVGINTAYTSPDATTWTTRTIPAGTYNAITTNGSLFVAVGASVCATSPDGITWTARTIQAGTWNSVEWSSALALFVAVGDGIISTSPDGITWTARTVPEANNWTGITWSSTLAIFLIVANDGTNRIASSVDGINWILLTTQADFSLDYQDGTASSIIHGSAEIHYLWRDEAGTVHTSGNTDMPAWNLGYLESTDSAPSDKVDPFYKFYLKKAPIRLDITDGDRIHFDPYWTLDPSIPIDASAIISEHFDTTKSPAWWQEIKTLAIFQGTEGGALPSTIERVAAYTPLVSTGFDGNLTPEVNNLQALAQAVDDLTLGGSIPATTAASDFQVGNGAGAWIKKTLAETVAILRTSLDSIFAPIAKGVTNGDSHDHSGGDGAQIAYSTLSGKRMFLPFGVFTSINPMTAAATPYTTTVDRTITYKSLSYCALVTTTNNVSNYWTITLAETITGAVVKTLNTSAKTAGTYGLLTTTTFDTASSDATDKGLYVACAKVGSPGNLYLFGPTLEVEI